MPKKWLCTTLTYHYCFFLLFVIADMEPVYRSHTVIIFHLPETEIFPKDLYADVVAFFHTFLGMTNVSESDIVYATRFGFENRTSQHRPVKVRFFSSEIPNAAYASRKKLIGTDFVIARPRSGKEVEDIRILSRYEKKLQAQYNNIKTALAGTTLFIEDLSHSVNDILRLERIENATEKLLAKGDDYDYDRTDGPEELAMGFNYRDEEINDILSRYKDKIRRDDPQAFLKIKNEKLTVNDKHYSVAEVLERVATEHKEYIKFFNQTKDRMGFLTSWSYPSTTPNISPGSEFIQQPKLWYTHKFEDLVNLNETTLKAYYNKEWRILKRGLMRDRMSMFAANIAAGMLWTEGYPYKVEELLEREQDIDKTKIQKMMRRMNISATLIPELTRQRLKAEKKAKWKRIRQEKKDYVFDILRIYEAHYSLLNKSVGIAGVYLWINSIPHYADACILRYEWEQQNPGHKYKWHPKRRAISSSELSSSSMSEEYNSLFDYVSSSDSDYKDEIDQSLSWSEKKRRKRERKKRKRPRKPSQFDPEERKRLNEAIDDNMSGGLGSRASHVI